MLYEVITFPGRREPCVHGRSAEPDRPAACQRGTGREVHDRTPGHIQFPAHRNDRTDRAIGWHVITSYSIHYTKLYDLAQAGVLKGPQALFFGKNMGINVFTGKLQDSIATGVIEPIMVKEQAIKSAAESAALILRIDDVITAKAPKGAQGGMPGGMGEE